MDKVYELDAQQIAQTTPLVTRLVFRLFRRRINHVASRVIAREHERGRINSRQLHELCSQFDPTQHGTVSRL